VYHVMILNSSLTAKFLTTILDLSWVRPSTVFY